MKKIDNISWFSLKLNFFDNLKIKIIKSTSKRASRNKRDNLIDPIDFVPVIIQAIFVLIKSWKIATLENELSHKLFVISKFKAPLRDMPSWNMSTLFFGNSMENKGNNIRKIKIQK